MPTDAERCPGRGRDRRRRRQLGGPGGRRSSRSRARSVRVVVRGKALKSTMSQYLVDRIERSPRIEVMTETEVVGGARHGDRRVGEPARPRDGSVEQVAAHGRVRDDRRRSVHRGGHRDARARRRRLPALRRGRGDAATGISAGRSRTASRTSSRRRARASSRPATSAPAPPSAWRARSATARWPCASSSRYWPPRARPWRLGLGR